MDLTLQKNEPKVSPPFFDAVLVDILSQLLGETEEKDSMSQTQWMSSVKQNFEDITSCCIHALTSYTQDMHKIKPAKRQYRWVMESRRSAINYGVTGY